jgi:hypothetical protein
MLHSSISDNVVNGTGVLIDTNLLDLLTVTILEILSSQFDMTISMTSDLTVDVFLASTKISVSGNRKWYKTRFSFASEAKADVSAALLSFGLTTLSLDPRLISGDHVPCSTTTISYEVERNYCIVTTHKLEIGIIKASGSEATVV